MSRPRSYSMLAKLKRQDEGDGLGLDGDDDDDGPSICADCNGSGEGSHDGARCSTCRGAGEVYEP